MAGLGADWLAPEHPAAPVGQLLLLAYYTLANPVGDVAKTNYAKTLFLAR